MHLAMVYALNIISGDWTFDRVFPLCKDDVRKQLEMMGYPELAKE